MRTWVWNVAWVLLLMSPAAMAGAPDLTASVEVVSMTTLSCTQVEVTVKATIKNIGDATCLGSWYADFWPSYSCACTKDPMVCNDPGTKPYDSKSSAPLGPGDEVTLTEKVILPPNVVGYHTLVFVDSVFNMCKESNESNNIACLDYEVSTEEFKADLVVSDCVLEPDPEFAGNVIFSATVVNQGCQPSEKEAYVDLFMSKASDVCTDHFGLDSDAFVKIPAGIPGNGGSEIVSGLYDACVAGDYKPVCLVNGDKLTPETDYTNNCSWPPPYVCVQIVDRPDLLVPQFEAKLAGVNPVYSGLIGNEGVFPLEETESFKLCIWPDKPDKPGLGEVPDVVGGEGFIINFEEQILVGDTVEFALGSKPIQNGCYKAWARVDCDGEVLEVDEKNNDTPVDYCIDLPGPDCYIEELVPKVVEDGNQYKVVYTVLVANQGEDPCDAPMDLDVFWDCAETPTLGSECLMNGGHTLIENPLDPGAKISFEIEWNLPAGVPAGTYTSWAWLDFMEVYHDTDTVNNLQSVQVEVPEYVPGFPNLAIEEFKCRTIGNNIEYEALVANSGDKSNKAPFRIDLFTDRDGAPTWGDLGDFSVSVQSLEPGKSESWKATWEGVPDGEYKGFLLVDTEMAVDENNEGDNLAGPRICVVCSTCQACEQGVYLAGACVCGDETVHYGFCCNGEWYAVGCPDNPDSEADVSQVENGSAVEMGNNHFGKADPNCGCRVGQPVSLSPASFLLALMALAIFLCTKRTTSTPASTGLGSPFGGAAPNPEVTTNPHVGGSHNDGPSCN